MEVKLGAGALVDIATGDELQKSTDSILDALSGPEPQPIRFTQYAQRVGQLSDPLIFGAPPMGRMWFILSLTLTGADPFTTIATALFALCIGDTSDFSLAHVRVPALSAPAYRTTSSDGLWCSSNESVYLVTQGVGAGQLVNANIQVEEWNMADITMRNPGNTPWK